MIEFKNVSKIYHLSKKPIVALEDISFLIQEGEFVSIVGKSGAGKTTVIKLLIGEERPTAGSILFRQSDIGKAGFSGLQKLRKRIGVIHQDYKLLVSKTVIENLNYIMYVLGISDKTIQRDIPQVLEIVGLEERAKKFPEQLSGGEKQRLAIARALIHRPEVIVADEPTGNLDLYNTYEIINLLKKIHQLNTTVVLFTHNKKIVDNLHKRVITLAQGRVIRDEENGKFIL